LRQQPFPMQVTRQCVLANYCIKNVVPRTWVPSCDLMGLFCWQVWNFAL
jgi:hypothetical protein